MRRRDESGQAAPLYITMVALLLFLAFAFFAVGEAGANRNGAQSAADAAALAAAQQSRDDFLTDDLLAHITQVDFLQQLFGGAAGPADGCGGDVRAAADGYAARNGAHVQACGSASEPWGFTVTVRADKPVGRSLVPGTGRARSTAEATAVVVPRCTFIPADDDTTAPPSPPVSPAPPDTDGGEDQDQQPSPGQLRCAGDGGPPLTVSIDPQHLDQLPDVADMFSVRLAEN